MTCVTEHQRPISLPPARIKGAYYALSYSRAYQYLNVERNGKAYFSIRGHDAIYWVDILEKNNGYDTLNELLHRHWKGLGFNF